MFDGGRNDRADNRCSGPGRCILVRSRWWAGKMVRVAVNIVTFNSAADIASCLDSLGQQTFRNFRIHILDNASVDDTIDRIASYDLDLVRSTVNSGFSKAHNDLIRS